MAAKSRSIIEKLFDGKTATIDKTNETFINELVIGHDAELPAGPRGVLAQRLLAMFADAKRHHDAPFGDAEESAAASLAAQQSSTAATVSETRVRRR